jgi:MFS family permease
MAFGQASVIALLAGILVQDLAIQGVHVTNTSAIYRLRPEARSRLTAGYVTCYFIGGASGSLVSSWLYAHFGWPAVVTAGAVLAALTLAYGALAPSARIPEMPSPPARA